MSCLYAETRDVGRKWNDTAADNELTNGRIKTVKNCASLKALSSSKNILGILEMAQSCNRERANSWKSRYCSGVLDKTLCLTDYGAHRVIPTHLYSTPKLALSHERDLVGYRKRGHIMALRDSMENDLCSSPYHNLTHEGLTLSLPLNPSATLTRQHLENSPPSTLPHPRLRPRN